MKKRREHRPLLAVCDAKRKEWFTNYDVNLMNEIRRIKLNQIQER